MKRSTSQKGIRKIGEIVKEKQNPKPKGNSVEYYGIFVAWSNGMKNMPAESIRSILIHLPISKVLPSAPQGTSWEKTR